jgi:signal transduction histidine kinase
MSFELSPGANANGSGKVAYTAILNFGFGDLALNLKEIDPGWIGKEIRHLRIWYFSIVAIVLLAVSLGLASLWRNASAQIKLAQKKDDFISAVSHELRTPLTSIRMYAEMLEKNWVKSQDKAVEYYGNMRQESERLSRLIENVLDFSRIQRGRKKYAFNAGDINKCVMGVVKMMRPYAGLKGFSIQTEPGRIEQATFDADAVTQIVVNLLDNAIKYARSAEDKTIIVRTKTDGKFTIIEVEDHGMGIQPEDQERIFDPFYRTRDASRKDGWGLGLYLVRAVVEHYGGKILVGDRVPDDYTKGAKFVVMIPSVE